MTQTPLPVRPSPRPGEPLTAYAARLADANGVTRSTVLPAHLRDVAVPRSDMSAVATLGGLDPGQAAHLTMDRYPPSIRGKGTAHREGWRLHFSAAWTCPGCTPKTGRSELLWQTALMPVCLTCRVYLRAGGPTCEPVSAAPQVLDIVTRLAQRAEHTVIGQRARNDIGRFRRLCASIAQTIDENWPARPEHLPPVDPRAARRWGAFPCADPPTVATILAAAAPALDSTSEHDRLAREAHHRRRTAPKRQPAKYLPKRPPAPPRQPAIVPGFTTADGARLRWFTTHLAHHVAAAGLHPDHVPALLPAAADDATLPDPVQWRTRSHAAIALHMLISVAHDVPASSSRACHAFGTADTETSPLLDGIRLSRGLHDTDADLLTDGLDTLLRTGLVNYRRRRDTLRAVTHLPPASAHRLRLPGNLNPAEGQQLAIGWLWTRFTHGPMWTSHLPLVHDRDVRAFDTSIDPETRLLLQEAGQQLLADTEPTTIPLTLASSTTTTRRFG